MMKTLPRILTALLLGPGLALASTPATQDRPRPRDPLVERGRYLVQAAGCNDCHTPGYAQREGKVPEAEWLTGDTVGWRGPWGTTYATNLRLRLRDFSEEQWLQFARHFRARPPMPWFNVTVMTDEDLRAIYRYTLAQGPAGKPAPAYLPPDRVPSQPFVVFPAPPGTPTAQH
ncbi:MAG TPA: hypothetical protein VNJ47_08740 [Nevskiales bacterium]|nr:hypothetical protein [Nevskiales bacterium]